LKWFIFVIIIYFIRKPKRGVGGKKEEKDHLFMNHLWKYNITNENRIR